MGIDFKDYFITDIPQSKKVQLYILAMIGLAFGCVYLAIRVVNNKISKRHL